jgi:small multidrug resistance family-3 protein
MGSRSAPDIAAAAMTAAQSAALFPFPQVASRPPPYSACFDWTRSAVMPGGLAAWPRARPSRTDPATGMTVVRSIVLFLLAALCEIGGAWLVWQGVREHRGWVWIGAGVLALGVYGFVATLQPDAQFGKILAAYGGVFVAASLAWGVVADGYRPDRFDLLGAAICLVGVGVIMYAPRG